MSHMTNLNTSFTKPDKGNGMFSVDNIWKLSVLAFMAANLYLQQNFTSHTQFEAMDDRVRKMEMILSQLEIKNQIDVVQNTTLQSIDLRLRELEKTAAVLLNSTKN